MLAALGIASALLTIVCYVPYIRDTLKGTTRPERASWTIWAVLGCISFAAQAADGATSSLWLTGAATVGVAVVAALSYRRGTGSFVRRDIVALCVAGVGLVMWGLTNDPVIALVIVIAVDAVGAGLTMVKAYHEPDTETLATWVIEGVAGILAVLSVGRFDVSLLLYPLYIVVINWAVTALIVIGRRPVRPSSKPAAEALPGELGTDR